MSAFTGFYRFLSIDVWGGLPSPWQRKVSQLYTTIYNASWSKWIIEPYCRHHYSDPNYLDQFVPASGKDRYETFQDFFSRKYKSTTFMQDKPIWPAEGLLCEQGIVDEMDLVKVKGEMRHLRTIFGEAGPEIPGDYYYANIFLHNNNYHRIHSPINGTVNRIERISGDLVLLRPWVYKNDPSLPALRNERLNIDICDDQGRVWYLSVVGGPAVGTIELPDHIEVGSRVASGDELSIFLLGSTCCMAFPVGSKAELNQQVSVGDSL